MLTSLRRIRIQKRLGWVGLVVLAGCENNKTDHWHTVPCRARRNNTKKFPICNAMQCYGRAEDESSRVEFEFIYIFLVYESSRVESSSSKYTIILHCNITVISRVRVALPRATILFAVPTIIIYIYMFCNARGGVSLPPRAANLLISLPPRTPNLFDCCDCCD